LLTCLEISFAMDALVCIEPSYPVHPSAKHRASMISMGIQLDVTSSSVGARLDHAKCGDAAKDPNVEDDFGLTALHCAAKKGDRKAQNETI